MKGVDEDLTDEDRRSDPGQDDFFMLNLDPGQKQEQRVDIEEIAVGQRSPAAAVVVGHENDIDQYLPGQGDQDQPPVQRFFAEEKKDEKQEGREKVPGDAGEAAEEVIKNIEIEPITKHKTSRSINWRLRFIVMRRDNFKCKNCGRSPAIDSSIVLHVDHVKAWTNGGETFLENLQTLCSKCNIGKSDL